MKIKIDMLPNYYIKKDGTFDVEKALNLCGKIAGVCYDKEGFDHLKDEPIEKTNRRIDLTLNNGHHSVYDHINISFNIHNIPKILAMIINNEKEYTTSEKSGRYTPVVKKSDSVITLKEQQLYNKWVDIFKIKIKEKYGNVFSDNKIQKLAYENARNLVTVFMPSEMIYTTSLRQINYLVSFMNVFIKDHDKNNDFESKISKYFKQFVSELKKLNILIPGLLKNEKNRRLSLFTSNISDKKEYFDEVYCTNYKMSFASIAQNLRHRTILYQIEIPKEKEYFISPIIADDDKLVLEWLKDIKSLEKVYPIGTYVLVNERGTYENFILKCKERLCSAAQYEIRMQTKKTLNKYNEELIKNGSYLSKDIKKYLNGSRCTFKDYKCNNDCHFKEGKNITSLI